MAMRSKKWLIKLILDTFSLLVVATLLIVFYLWVSPVQRGFYCDDITIRYPYRENTINEYLLFALALVPILTTIPTIELFRYRNKKLSTRIYKSFYQELYDKLLPYTFGLLFSLLCTLIAKVSTGRLRPYFHSICKPNVICANNDFQYIEDFQCPGYETSPPNAVNEIRMSFMSGHSSLMAYSMVYLTIYIQKRLPMNNSSGVMLRSLIQGLALNLAIYVGYTRISDYWHHWSDVLMGLIQGSISSLITAYHLSDLFIDKTLSKPQLNSKNSNSSVDSKETEVQVRLIKQTSI